MIVVEKNGVPVDIALIDAVVSDELWAGSKAVWNTKKISDIFVTRCHPASIGFSAVAGCVRVVTAEEDKGFHIKLAEQGSGYCVPLAARIMEHVYIADSRELAMGEKFSIKVEKVIMVALDGEREVYGAPDDTVSFTVKRNGPLRVKIREILQEAAAKGFYKTT